MPKSTIPPIETLDLNTQLAVMRTRLAAERTLMAWVRTSLALIALGFTIIKFFQYLKGETVTNLQAHMSSTTKLGALLILAGILALIPGIIEHHRQLEILHKDDRSSARWSFALIFAILVGLVGLYAFYNAVVNRFFQ